MADSLTPRNLLAEARERALAPLSGRFVLDQVSGGMAGMDSRDAVLVMAINQANIAALTRDPEARQRYGGLETPAPDDERRPVSLSAIAASLALPYETVRRRIQRLAARGVCELTDHGAVVPETFLASPAYLGSVVAAHGRLYRFYREVEAAGLMEALPPSRYPPEPAVPIRAALRPLSDYLLRNTEHLTAITGELISGLALFGLLSTQDTLPAPACSTAALARRLAMPHETVRRRIGDLAQMGLVARDSGGVWVPEAALAGAELTGLFRDNAADVQRLFTTLAERGVIEAWDRLGVAAPA